MRRTGPLDMPQPVTSSTQPGCPPQSVCGRMLVMISRMVSAPCRSEIIRIAPQHSMRRNQLGKAAKALAPNGQQLG
jgi:hypothetical protein